MRYDRRALKRMRAERGVSRDALARAAGLSERTLYFLERGVTEPKASTLAKLAAALEVSVDTFFVKRNAA